MMKKNLNVDAMILDLRNVQEDFLDRYEQIKLDCMIALTSPRVPVSYTHLTLPTNSRV